MKRALASVSVTHFMCVVAANHRCFRMLQFRCVRIDRRALCTHNLDDDTRARDSIPRRRHSMYVCVVCARLGSRLLHRSLLRWNVYFVVLSFFPFDFVDRRWLRWHVIAISALYSLLATAAQSRRSSLRIITWRFVFSQRPPPLRISPNCLQLHDLE